ncbi:EAL domain-containing protein [Geodermatophilus sp. SYSU D01176]
MPAAEQAGLLRSLGGAVPELALDAAARWWREHGVPVSVNLITDLDLPAAVAAALARHGLPAAALTLELVEDTLVSDPERGRSVLGELRRTGVRTSIDDYGTGYSSLAHLRTLPADELELELDRSLTQDVGRDPRATAIVRHTVTLAHDLGLTLTAEGVEGAETAAALTALGCDTAQRGSRWPARYRWRRSSTGCAHLRRYSRCNASGTRLWAPTGRSIRGVPSGASGQDGRRHDQPEVHPVFRKKTHGQIIGEELQEGLVHIGTAVAEARKAATEQLAPRVEAAREASGPALDAAKGAVAPKVAAAVAVAAPAVEAALDAIAPRVEAARDAVGPRVEATLEALGPRVEAAREAATPHLAAAVTAAQAAAAKAAADLAPRIEAARDAAQKALETDLVPRLTAAQAATLAYAAPRVVAAREAVTPVLESTRESLASGLLSARDELELRRLELAATTAKAAKKRAELEKAAAKKRRELEKKAARAGKAVTRKVGNEPSPRRWPWLLAVLGIAAAVAVVLRRRSGSDDLWTPAPTGDGPVPSYREDPVPSSPSNSGKTVSTAQTTAGDATPPDTDAGSWAQQSHPADAAAPDVPGTATGGTEDPALDTATAAPDDQPQTASGGIGSDSEDPRNPAT